MRNRCVHCNAVIPKDDVLCAKCKVADDERHAQAQRDLIEQRNKIGAG